MILIDANLLIYAYDPDSAQHEASRTWLESVLSGSEHVRFAWVTLWAFIRIVTNPRVFIHPMTTAEAHAAVASWLAQPNADIAEPEVRHLDLLAELLRDGQAGAALVMDAALAAIAVEHGATLYTTDRDFSRFPQLEWRNPLEPG
jgi:hypothetical protein